MSLQRILLNFTKIYAYYILLKRCEGRFTYRLPKYSMNALYAEFTRKLEQLFGPFDHEHKRFEKSNNSIIARDLGYSDAQFSRLINETATEGEYQRALQNIDRIIKVIAYEIQIKKLQKGGQGIGKSQALIGAFFLLIATLALLYFFMPSELNDRENNRISRDHTLQWTFESSLINPYVSLDDLPGDCNFPCYKYQGKWNLEKSYKLPFFRERNGFHYVATEVKMYARCMPERSKRGDLIEGYEYQKHEIWYDQREWPIDSFMIINQENTPNTFYQNMDFNAEPDFIKIANIHTFFRNEFLLKDSLIQRTGKVVGRDLERIPRADLLNMLEKNDLNFIENELSKIIANRLQDFSVPVKCKDAYMDNSFNSTLRDGNKMQFDCQLTTSGFPINYSKTYILQDQYIKNDCVEK
ncbi:MAG: hypothetical protein AAF789_01060 [Bacteroidota bacterium]